VGLPERTDPERRPRLGERRVLQRSERRVVSELDVVEHDEERSLRGSAAQRLARHHGERGAQGARRRLERPEALPW
jgi:hypothetical protein